jgi:hypothetical protein
MTASAMCRSVSPDAIRRTAPDRLSAIRPQVEQRLTAPPQLRPNPLRLSLLLSRRRRAPLFGGRFLFAALSAARRLVIRPLTRPVAPRGAAQRERWAIAERQDRFHHPRVNASSFPDPERLLSTSAAPKGISAPRSAYHRDAACGC